MDRVYRYWWAGILACAAIVGWVFVGLVNGGSDDDDQLSSVASVTSDSRLSGGDSSTAQLLRLESRIAGLEANLRHAPSATERAHSEAASEDPEEAAPPPLDPEEMIAAQEAQMQRHEDYLRRLVSEQPPDDEWQWEVSEAVRSAAAATGVHVEVRSVSCGTTVCEIVFGHEGAMDHQEVHFAAMDREMPGFGGPALVRRRVVDGRYETTMMLARPGGMLPRPEPESSSM